jgi:hypothetical protein
MIDIFIQEQGSGGEIIIRNNDVVTVNGVENQPYAAQFGGSEWIFNDLFLVDDQKFTATTEQALLNNPLTSAGRITIEAAMNADLAYLPDAIPGTSVTISTSIPQKNRLDATIEIDGQTFGLNWNPDGSFLNYTLIE